MEESETDESETEEGEACLGNEEDACSDPKVDLSYIIPPMAVQREFEGGVSAESLGAKYGRYSSFLPGYKRPPSILCQPGSPQKGPGRSGVSSSHRLSHEGACNGSSVQINAPISDASCTLTKDLDLGGLARKDASTTAAANHTEDNDLINKGSRGAIRIDLKACRNVGPDNISANAKNSGSTSGVRQNATTKSWADSLDVEHGKLNVDAHDLSSSTDTLEVELQQSTSPTNSGHQTQMRQQQPNTWAKKQHFKVNPTDCNPNRIVGQPIQLNMELVHANLARLERGLVGKLLNKRLPYEILKAELCRRWDQFGDFSLTTVSADYFICIFKHMEASEEILLSGPWYIHGHIMALERWSASFDPASLTRLKAPIWVRFPALPLLYWDTGCITRIAEAIGEPLYIDDHTTRMEQSEFARVCVSIDLSQQLPPGTSVCGLDGNFWQPFEYEGISYLCFHCGRIGHHISICPSRPPGLSLPPSSIGERKYSVVRPTSQNPSQPELDGSVDSPEAQAKCKKLERIQMSSGLSASLRLTSI